MTLLCLSFLICKIEVKILQPLKFVGRIKWSITCIHIQKRIVVNSWSLTTESKPRQICK